MNQPRQPKDPPTHDGVNPASDPVGTGEHGIPDGMEDHEAKGTPDSGRQASEAGGLPCQGIYTAPKGKAP